MARLEVLLLRGKWHWHVVANNRLGSASLRHRLGVVLVTSSLRGESTSTALILIVSSWALFLVVMLRSTLVVVVVVIVGSLTSLILATVLRKVDGLLSSHAHHQLLDHIGDLVNILDINTGVTVVVKMALEILLVF